ncbi:MAG: hypothetical protein JNM13_07180 [Hyphomicrobiaceae bacterium]|nr:hypothetical protein [Hyphomicrobiaceae bacterium]
MNPFFDSRVVGTVLAPDVDSGLHREALLSCALASFIAAPEASGQGGRSDGGELKELTAMPCHHVLGPFRILPRIWPTPIRLLSVEASSMIFKSIRVYVHKYIWMELKRLLIQWRWEIPHNLMN